MKQIFSKAVLKKSAETSFQSLFFSIVVGWILTALLIGCVTTADIKRNYCKGIDTYKQGQIDVSRGKTENFFNKEAKKCAEYGVQLNQEQYEKGRQKELKNFCSYEKGYEFGLNGKKYLNICPKKLAADFFKGYRKGDKKCLYEVGYSDAVNGKITSFSSAKCLKLSADQDKTEYTKGWTAGLKVFCSYKTGYEFGLNGKKYQNICPKKLEVDFFKGYRKGDKKCLYEAGYSDAVNGETPSFSSTSCLKLSANQGQREYTKGRTAGLKVFCSYKTGYDLGLWNGHYQNICPKKLEVDFFKGYTLGLQEYKRDQRQKELLAIEQEKLAIERKRTQQLLAIEKEKIAVEKERIKDQKASREDFLKLQMHSKQQPCDYSSECYTGGVCRYNSRLKDYTCQYD